MLPGEQGEGGDLRVGGGGPLRFWTVIYILASNYKHSNIKSPQAMNTTRRNPSRSKSPYEIYTDKNNNQQYVMYEVGKKLGQGGFASVHEIKKKSENSYNAAKIIDLRNKYGSIDKDR